MYGNMQLQTSLSISVQFPLFRKTTFIWVEREELSQMSTEEDLEKVEVSCSGGDVEGF